MKDFRKNIKDYKKLDKCIKKQTRNNISSSCTTTSLREF